MNGQSKGLYRNSDWYYGIPVNGNPGTSNVFTKTEENTKTLFHAYTMDMYNRDQREFCRRIPYENERVECKFTTNDESDAEFFAEMASVVLTKPPEGYVCVNCNIPGHHIKNCTVNLPMSQKTNYQGNKQSVGVFKCSKCSNGWVSLHSFAQQAQLCRKCSNKCYPFKMYSLEKAIEYNIFRRRQTNGGSVSSRNSTLSESSSSSISPFKN